MPDPGTGDARGLEVREAVAGEAEEVLAAYEWLFAPPGIEPPGWDPAAALERLRETLASERSGVIVAVEAGRVVGICSVCLDLRSVRFGDRCWVEDLAVDPGRRSRGIGGALLDAAEAWAAERGATHLELDSGEARTDAHRFYESRDPIWRSKQYTWMLGE
jgi:GNAT superfamily N-acetyltransferase